MANILHSARRNHHDRSRCVRFAGLTQRGSDLNADLLPLLSSLPGGAIGTGESRFPKASFLHSDGRRANPSPLRTSRSLLARRPPRVPSTIFKTDQRNHVTGLVIGSGSGLARGGPIGMLIGGSFSSQLALRREHDRRQPSQVRNAIHVARISA